MITISNEKVLIKVFLNGNLEKEIYQLVYQLYGLREKEIKIVEGGK